MNYLDLFSGIGGFALGLYWAGWRFDEHYFSEVDEYAIKVYRQRFPDAVPLGDIVQLNILRDNQDWIITGGFPCQDISVAGKGEGIEGRRSSLWFEMWRVIRELRPRWVVAENVGAITHRGLGAVVNSLAKIGYDCEWQDIRASDMGAPHRRERIWIIAYPKKDGWEGPICSNITNGKKSMWPKSGTSSALDTCLYFFNEFEKRMGEPAVFGMDTRISHKVDRLGSLGNSIVPQIAEIIFRQIGKNENHERRQEMAD